MKKKLLLSMGICFCLLIFMPLSMFAQDLEVYTFKLTQLNSSYQFWTTPPSERVFKDDTLPSETGSEIKVYAAQNEFEPFQLVVKPASSGNVTININDFGSGIVTEIYQVKYVNIATPTDSLGKTGDYPDPLWPIKNGDSISLTANENTSFWFSVSVSKTTPSGDYSANIQIGGITIPVSLHVFNFAVPDEIHVKSQMNFSHDTIIQKYGVSSTGNEYWMYVDMIKQFFIDHRLTPKSVLWSGGLTNGGAPYIDYDCNNALFTDNDGIWGFEKPAQRYLDGTGLMDGKFTDYFNKGTGFPSFMAMTFNNNDSSADQRPSTFCNLTRSDSDWYTGNNPDSAYNKKWFEYIKSIQNYLEGLEYLESAYYYFANEPNSEAAYDAVAWYSRYLKQAAPNFKLMVSEGPRTEIFNDANYVQDKQIDIWLPVLNQYDPVISHDREKNHNGEETWIYFLHGTRPPFFNPITLDHPGIESKLTGWFLWKYRARGIAYYSLNNWGPNPWTDPMNDNHNGDLFMLYPPSESNTNIAYASNNHRMVPSIRFELMRDSIEDYEYLYVLNGGNRPEVDQVNTSDAQADKIISGLTSYTRDSEFMYNLRRVIGLKNGNEITAIPDIQPPPKHPRAEGSPGNYYINFQDTSGNPSSNPLVVDGKTYMKIGWNEYEKDTSLGYGWYGDMANIMYRYLDSGPNELQKSIIFDDWGREKTFEFDLPNGTYNVTVSAGRQDKTYSRNKIDIEGISFINDEASNLYIVRTNEISISDNKLTMAMGIFDEYTMLNYLDIEAIEAPEIPIADFTIDKTSGNSPLTIQFTDTSTNSPDAWFWDFNNNGSVDSTIQNPSYNYETAGTYTVTLTALNADGSDSETKADLITVLPEPGAYETGDLNADGNVDLTDAIIALKVLTEFNTDDLVPANYANLGVDADGNQTIGLAEAIYILRTVAGLK